MKDLGEVRTYLDINIKHDRIKNEITLDQREYIESLDEIRYYRLKGSSHFDGTKPKTRTGTVREK